MGVVPSTYSLDFYCCLDMANFKIQMESEEGRQSSWNRHLWNNVLKSKSQNLLKIIQEKNDIFIFIIFSMMMMMTIIIIIVTITTNSTDTTT
jgi:hypothetical protein